MSLPDSFTTKRLTAERIRPEHTDEIHRLLQDPAHMAMIGGVPPESETAVYMQRSLDHWERYGFGVWILRDRAGQDVAGRVLLRHLALDEQDEIEVGYGLVPAYRGQGLAAEAAGACLEFARKTLRVPSVVAVTRPDHHRSHRVLTKIGMLHDRDFVHDDAVLALFRTPMNAAG